MKAHLMYRDRDFDPKEPLPSNATELTQDLALDVLLDAMSDGDPFLREVAKQATLISLREPVEIAWRQKILADAMEHPEVVRGLYGLAVESIEREKRIWGWMTTKYPNEMLHRAVDVLELFSSMLTRVREVADQHGEAFQSTGFRQLFSMLQRELDNAYLERVADHLERLKFRGGVLMSAELGAANKGAHYILRKPPDVRKGWLERLQEWMAHFAQDSGEAYTYEAAERDEAGFNALSELKSEGIAPVAAALAQSTDHILSFFRLLRLEVGFYVGCLNLRDRINAKGGSVSIPQLAAMDDLALSCEGLFDPSLLLSMDNRVVPNNIAADGKSLVFMTGANRGGKSTLLRAIGLAQLMMQSGMFVAADSFRASVCAGVYTHFKREEDATMKSGKLDEELARMSLLVDQLVPGCVVLLNESFASTNEREGSEIARQIVRASLEARVRVLYVTHMFDLAQGFYAEHRTDTHFLRAERLETGKRTFRLLEGKPLPTSYGEDLYSRIFESLDDPGTSDPTIPTIDLPPPMNAQ